MKNLTPKIQKAWADAIKATTHKDVIDLLNEKFPELNAVDSMEFYDRSKSYSGMWFKGSEDGVAPDGMPLFDYWNEERDVHIELSTMLHKYGYYAEPYDSGTLMAGKL